MAENFETSAIARLLKIVGSTMSGVVYSKSRAKKDERAGIAGRVLGSIQ